nr:RNA polymerase II subunit 5-mediating protein homolog isoform X2 [Tanacetum cinerariifolium]
MAKVSDLESKFKQFRYETGTRLQTLETQPVAMQLEAKQRHEESTKRHDDLMKMMAEFMKTYLPETTMVPTQLTQCASSYGDFGCLPPNKRTDSEEDEKVFENTRSFSKEDNDEQGKEDKGVVKFLKGDTWVDVGLKHGSDLLLDRIPEDGWYFLDESGLSKEPLCRSNLKEGIVEIREDHVEETPNEDKATTAGEDDFARILSRMEELEKEELENEELESEVAEEGEDLDTADLSHLMSRTSFETEVEAKNEHSTSQRSLLNHTQQDPKDSPAFPVSKDSYVKVPTSSGSEARPRLVEHNKSKNSLPPTPVSKNEVSTLASSSSNDRSKASAIAPVSKEVSNHGSSSTNDSSKAFTGSIVERTHNLENNQKGQTPAPVSKPVSRFKMQRK